MRLRFGASILIFLSAYAPLSVIFLIQDFDFAKKEVMHPRLAETSYQDRLSRSANTVKDG